MRTPRLRHAPGFIEVELVEGDAREAHELFTALRVQLVQAHGRCHELEIIDGAFPGHVQVLQHLLDLSVGVFEGGLLQNLLELF